MVCSTYHIVPSSRSLLIRTVLLQTADCGLRTAACNWTVDHGPLNHVLHSTDPPHRLAKWNELIGRDASLNARLLGKGASLTIKLALDAAPQQDPLPTCITCTWLTRRVAPVPLLVPWDHTVYVADGREMRDDEGEKHWASKDLRH